MTNTAFATIERRYNDDNEMIQEKVFLVQPPTKRMDIVLARYRVEIVPLFTESPDVQYLRLENEALRLALVVAERLLAEKSS